MKGAVAGRMVMISSPRVSVMLRKAARKQNWPLKSGGERRFVLNKRFSIEGEPVALRQREDPFSEWNFRSS